MVDETHFDYSRYRRKDTACAECVAGTDDTGFVVPGFRCLYHLNDRLCQLEQMEARLAQLEHDCAKDMASCEREGAQLERNYAELSNQLSLIPSLQRCYLEMEARLAKLEAQVACSPHKVPANEVRAHYGNTVFPDGVALTCAAHPTLQFPTLDSLVDAIERLFDCRDGFHGPYALPTGEEQLRYRVLGAITSTKTAEDLRRALYYDLLNLYGSCNHSPAKPILYWRFAKEQRISEEFEILDRRKIRTRVAIPEANWSVCKFIVPEMANYPVI